MFKKFSTWRAALSFVVLSFFAPLVFAAPQVTGFDVDQVTALVPGTALEFTLSGTPRSRASIRIGGVPRVVTLKETGRGLYEGSYTIRKKDRITTHSTVVATLSQGNSHTMARLGKSLVAVAAPAPVPPAVAIAIERFTVNSHNRLEPGSELVFTLMGTPGGRATYTINNVIANRAMQEVRPGTYKGRYTIRRQDNLPSALQVVATLQASGQIVRAQLEQRNDNAPVATPFTNLSPGSNESVPYSNNFTVTGRFDDDRHRGIDPRSVQIIFDGRDVTAQSNITTQGFTYRPTNVVPGNHTVEVRGRDFDGNIGRTNWDFRMLDAAPIAGFPLDIMSPNDGAEVGSGAIEVRGRTLPNASVQVLVTAGIFGLNQRIFENTVVADRQGYFSFSFQPQMRVPGAHYDVSVRATRDNEMRERKISLIQQR